MNEFKVHFAEIAPKAKTWPRPVEICKFQLRTRKWPGLFPKIIFFLQKIVKSSSPE